MHHGQVNSVRVILHHSPNLLSNTRESFGILLGMEENFPLGYEDGVTIFNWLVIDECKLLSWLLRIADGIMLWIDEGTELVLPLENNDISVLGWVLPSPLPISWKQTLTFIGCFVGHSQRLMSALGVEITNVLSCDPNSLAFRVIRSRIYTAFVVETSSCLGVL